MPSSIFYNIDWNGINSEFLMHKIYEISGSLLMKCLNFKQEHVYPSNQRYIVNNNHFNLNNDFEYRIEQDIIIKNINYNLK